MMGAAISAQQAVSSAQMRTPALTVSTGMFWLGAGVKLARKVASNATPARNAKYVTMAITCPTGSAWTIVRMLLAVSVMELTLQSARNVLKVMP